MSDIVKCVAIDDEALALDIIENYCLLVYMSQVLMLNLKERSLKLL